MVKVRRGMMEGESRPPMYQVEHSHERLENSPQELVAHLGSDQS